MGKTDSSPDTLGKLLESWKAEEQVLKEQERRIYELEDSYLKETIVEGNVWTGWGESRSAPIRFRNANIRRRKRQREQLPIVLSKEEQEKVTHSRFASFSSITFPAENKDTK